jgi:hypothetical protein
VTIRHLLAKDVRLVAPYLWMVVPVHALYSIQAFLSPELYFWLNLAAALAWTVAVTAIEWHLDADPFVASLPVTRAAVVSARYASAIGGLATGAALFVLYGHLTMAVATARVTAHWQRSPSWATADGVVAFLAVGYVLVTAFLPFFFRWGLPLGGALFTAAAAVILSAGTVLARVLSGTTPAGDALAGVAGSLSWSDAVRGWLLALSAAWGPWLAALMVLAGAATLGAASMRLSIRSYERREL